MRRERRKGEKGVEGERGKIIHTEGTETDKVETH